MKKSIEVQKLGQVLKCRMRKSLWRIQVALEKLKACGPF